MRYFSIAIDEYVHFEMLEALRRGTTTVALLALLLGLPALVFLLVINAGWLIAIAAAIMKLRQRHAFGGDFRRNFVYFVAFLRSNRRQLLSSGIYALSETYIYNFPYFLAPWAYGLGAPTIILDTTFKVYRVANQFYSAACDSLVPRQTSALAERDGPAMVRATWLAAAFVQHSGGRGLRRPDFFRRQDFCRTARPGSRHAARDHAHHHHAARRQSGADGLA